MISSKRVAVAAAMWVAFPCAALAQTSGAAFLSITPSARSYSLGLSNVVSALGAQAIGANPANLGLMNERFEAFSAYASLMDGMQYEHLSAAFSPVSEPFGMDGFGLSVTRLQIGGLQEADANANQTGNSFAAGSMAVSLSGSAKLTSDLRVGLTGKAIQSQIGSYRSGTSLGSDLGLTYTLSQFRQPVSVGASVTNMGQGLKFLDQRDPLPTAANLGMAVPFGPAMAVVEVNRLINDKKTEVGMGMEYGIGPVALRAGYLAQNQAGNLALQDARNKFLAGLSFGLGVHAGPVKLDYAVSQQAVEFGTTQRVALSLAWGGSKAAAGGEPWKKDPNRSDWLLRSMGSY